MKSFRAQLTHRGLLWSLSGHKISAVGRHPSGVRCSCGTWTQHFDEVGVDGQCVALLAFAENCALAQLHYPSRLRLQPIDGVPWEINVIPDYYAYAAAKSAYLLVAGT